MPADSIEMQEYLNRLKEADEAGRIELYREIGDLGIPEGNAVLIEGLSDPNARVRSVVESLLTDFADERAVAALLEVLRREEPGIRSRAISILGHLGPMVLDQVEEYLLDSDPDVRIFAADILGKTGLREAFPILEKAFGDPEENVRYATVEALGRIREPKAIPLLIGILDDEWVRYTAVESLGLLQAREAIPHLLRIYQEDEWVRHAVVEALGNIGDPAQVDFLLDVMKMDNEMIVHAALTALTRIEQLHPCGVVDRIKACGVDINEVITSALAVHEPAIRRGAVWTLGAIGNEDHIPLLTGYLADFDDTIRSEARRSLVNLGARHMNDLLRIYDLQDEQVRKELIDVLGEIGDPGAIPVIVRALEEEPDPIRETAARTLGRFKDRSVVEPLIGHLNDPNAEVRSAAAFSLGALKAVKAIRFLMPLLEDRCAGVREAASEALGRIGTGEIIKHAAPLLKHHRMEVRQAAIQCLGLIMDRRANGHLIDALSNSERGVRRFAAGILGKRKVLQAAGHLVMALLDEDWQVRKSAAVALGELGDPRSLDALLASLDDENMWVRYAAATALGRIGDKNAILPLRVCAREDKGPVRISAIEALRDMKDPDLIAFLKPLAEDPDEEVRRVINGVLGKHHAGCLMPNS